MQKVNNSSTTFFGDLFSKLEGFIKGSSSNTTSFADLSAKLAEYRKAKEGDSLHADISFYNEDLSKETKFNGFFKSCDNNVDVFFHINSPYLLVKIRGEDSHLQFIACSRVHVQPVDFQRLYVDIRKISSVYSICLNGGTHGSPCGSTVYNDSSLKYHNDPDFSFILNNEEVAMRPNEVEKGNPPQYPKQANIVINDFCFSLQVYKTTSEFTPADFINKVEDIYKLSCSTKEREVVLSRHKDTNMCGYIYSKILEENNFSILKNIRKRDPAEIAHYFLNGYFLVVREEKDGSDYLYKVFARCGEKDTLHYSSPENSGYRRIPRFSSKDDIVNLKLERSDLGIFSSFAVINLDFLTEAIA